MPKTGLRIILKKPRSTINRFVFDKWAEMLVDLESWMKSVLVHSLTYGGVGGIQGIAQTDFYKFIKSNNGLSQLGIEASEPPKLLNAYATKAFSVQKKKKIITLKFGDIVKLKLATPHPASGTGHLQIESWLEWITSDKGSIRTVPQRGYVPRSGIPDRAHKYIRLSAPLGGLMLPKSVFGSTGFWKVPSRFTFYEIDWFQDNIKKIEDAILDKAISLFTQKVKA